jgi:hypothetical protein
MADKEHYIPYRPANHHREAGLGLGDSFAKQAQSEVMDMMGEEDADMRKRKSQVHRYPLLAVIGQWRAREALLVRHLANGPALACRRR